MNLFRLDGKVALITGGAGAIGAATARQMAELGAQIFLVDLRESAAEAVASDIGTAASAFEADVSKPAKCKEMVAACVAKFGRLDLLVNNAGICPRRSITDSTEEDWEQIVGVNQKSVFFSSQAGIAELRKAKGRIINVASYAGRAGAAVDACIYSGTKGAIIAMTKAMARELAPDILVNAVAPGPVESDLVRGVSPEALKAIAASIPLKRLAHAAEVAASICYLASGGASYLTGATLDVNGGWYMT